MAPSQFSSQPSDDFHAEKVNDENAEAQPAPSAPGDQTERRLLDKVLMQTALESINRENIDDRLLNALVDVARRLRGQPWSLDPVAVELVHTALTSQFDMISSQARDWRAVSMRVTEMLFNDPIVHDRLKSLWLKLSQE